MRRGRHQHAAGPEITHRRPPGPLASGLQNSFWIGFAPARHEPLAEAVMVEVAGAARAYRYTGVVTLADPASGQVLSRHRFSTGGAGRGSAPFGRYELGAYRDDNGIGPRWMVRQAGREDGEVWDPALRDVRTWIEVHRGRTGRTLGCFAIMEGYREFARNLSWIIGRLGHVTFTVGEAITRRTSLRIR